MWRWSAESAGWSVGRRETWNAARRSTVLKDRDFSMAAAWCVRATGRYLWILEKHVHPNEQPLGEYKRDP